MTVRKRPFLPLIVLLLGLLGCGGGSSPEAPPPPPVTPPVITVQPQPVSVPSGVSASFTVLATGNGTLLYQWKRNGTEIPNSNAPSYSTGPTNVLDHGATFAVSISNSAGSVTSATVMLTVNESPSITQQPNDLSVTEGQPAVFVTKAQGTPPLAYQWKRNGVAIPGATQSTYTIPSALRSDDLARFSTVVSNGLGTTESRSAELRVIGVLVPPTITMQPGPVTAEVGQTVVFFVTATGTAPLRYQWRRNSTQITGATGATYTINNVQAADAGSYSVVVSNDAGSVTSNPATLTVAVTPLNITGQPSDTFVGTGQAATFHVVAEGSPPITYQWRKNGADITGATLASYTTPPTVIGDNNSLFTVRLTNPAGSVTSSPAKLQVFLARTIHGSAGIVKEGPDGEASFPADLRSANAAAFQPNGVGGYNKVAGIGAVDGTFAIPGMPPGAYLAVLDLADGSPWTGLWTTLEDLDFRRYKTGRSGANLSVVGQTSVKLALSGSLPAPISHLELYAPTLSLLLSSTGPMYQWPWMGLPLFEAAQDSVWVHAYKAETVAAGAVTSIQGSYLIPPFNLPDIGEKLINVPFTLPAPSASFRFQADIDAYGNLLPLVNPAYVPGTNRGPYKFLIRSQVYGADLGPIPEWATILDLSTQQIGLYDTGPMPYADPFPAEWKRFLIARQEFTLDLQVPGNAPVRVSDAIQEIWPVAQLQPTPLQPMSVPVDQPRINGVTLFAPPASVGATPILTWTARVGSQPTYYTVTVFEVDTVGVKLVTRGEFHTEAPSLILPTGLLKPGSFYVARINMVWARSYDPLNPLKPVWPIATSPVYSAVFKP